MLGWSSPDGQPAAGSLTAARPIPENTFVGGFTVYLARKRGREVFIEGLMNFLEGRINFI
jgi:hypothetical protein